MNNQSSRKKLKKRFIRREESDEATLGFRATLHWAREGGIFGIRRGYRSSPQSFGVGKCISLESGNVFLNQISQDTLDIDL